MQKTHKQEENLKIQRDKQLYVKYLSNEQW